MSQRLNDPIKSAKLQAMCVEEVRYALRYAVAKCLS